MKKMILPVYIYGQPVLRKEAEDITPDYPNLKVEYFMFCANFPAHL